MSIRVLAPLIVDQIAAGEVVERPASVVKELVENALDAGARRITIDIEDGGRTLVRVVDDGCGIPAEELELAFASHATSKLGEVADLEHIATLGFRGEALASIGAVARARIRSRSAGVAAGAEIENHGGRLGAVRPAGAPVGTMVEVRDLFFNTPARRKFLKRDATELGHCVEAVLRLALGHVEAEFLVRHGGREALHLPPADELAQRARAALGKSFLDEAVILDESRAGVHLCGVLGKPSEARRDARQYLFLNGRFIRDRAIARALKDAYQPYLFGPVQPAYVLHLGLDPAQVDPNVHPTKIEVRFQGAGQLFGIVRRAVQEVLAAAGHASPGGRLLDAQLGKLDLPEVRMPLAVRERSAGPATFSGEGAGASAAADGPAGQPREPCAIVLQVHDRFLVRETSAGLEVIDQHALHERVNYEDFKRDLEQRGIAIQQLLQPEVVDVAPPLVARVEASQGDLRRLGVDLRPFGSGAVALFGLPARLENQDPRSFLDRVLELLGGLRAGAEIESEVFLRDVLASRACRSAVMAGDPLRPDQIRHLLERAAELENDTTCPHGRPTRIAFPLADLERAFKRR